MVQCHIDQYRMAEPSAPVDANASMSSTHHHMELTANELNVQGRDDLRGFNRMINAEAVRRRKSVETWVPKVHIVPANMSIVGEDDSLIIECHVDTLGPATVLLKHDGEIIHEWHIS